MTALETLNRLTDDDLKRATSGTARHATQRSAAANGLQALISHNLFCDCNIRMGFGAHVPALENWLGDLLGIRATIL